MAKLPGRIDLEKTAPSACPRPLLQLGLRSPPVMRVGQTLEALLVLLGGVLVAVLGAVVLGMAWPGRGLALLWPGLCHRGRHGYAFVLLLLGTRYSSLSLTPPHLLPLDALASLSLPVHLRLHSCYCCCAHGYSMLLLGLLLLCHWPCHAVARLLLL
jgi:hypothetical protein